MTGSTTAATGRSAARPNSGATAHVVLTRFNVRFRDEPDPRNLSTEWLEQRLVFFRRYTLPSMEAQSNTDFRWLLLCDVASPQWFKTEIESLLADTRYSAVFLDVPVSEEDGCPPALRDAIVRCVPTGTSTLITLRIDNDDALRGDFIEYVTSHAPLASVEALIFPVGYSLYFPSGYSPGGGVLTIEYSRGAHFAALIEPYDPHKFATVFHRPHNELYKAFPVRQKWTMPIWLELVHGGNVSNYARNGLPAGPRRLQREFAIDMRDIQHLSTVSLRVRQGAFLLVGAPRYLAGKAVRRWRHHGRSRIGRFRRR